MTKPDPSLTEFIIDKAVREPAFRSSLLASPRRAIETALGRPVPKNLHLKVVEDTPDTVHLVLAPTPRALEEAEMQGIAAAGERLCSSGMVPKRSYDFFNHPGSAGGPYF